MIYGEYKFREMARRPDSGNTDYDIVFKMKRSHRRQCKLAVQKAVQNGLEEDDFDYQPPKRPWEFRDKMLYKGPYKWVQTITAHLPDQSAKKAFFRSRIRKYHHYRFYSFYEPVFSGRYYFFPSAEDDLKWEEERGRCLLDIMSKPDGHRLIHHMFDAVLQGTQDVKPYLWRLHRFKSRQVDELYTAWVETGKNIQELKRRFW